MLTAKSMRRVLQVTEGITANIFHMINSLAVDAIVERAGPEMLRMLSSHMMGENRARSNDAAETMLVQAAKFRTTSQMHLI